MFDFITKTKTAFNHWNSQVKKKCLEDLVRTGKY